jgi:hypothetical protein
MIQVHGKKKKKKLEVCNLIGEILNLFSRDH